MCASPILAFDLGPRRKRCNGIDHDHIDRAAPYERFGDLERLFARVGLGDEKVIGAYAELAGVRHVKRMLRIDESGLATRLLRLGYDMERQRCLARGFGAVDLDDPSPRHATHAKCDVQAQGSGGYRGDPRRDLLFAQTHDGTFAELFLDLAYGQFQCLQLVLIRHYVSPFVSQLPDRRLMTTPTRSMDDHQFTIDDGRPFTSFVGTTDDKLFSRLSSLVSRLSSVVYRPSFISIPLSPFPYTPRPMA
jgi:hypothetical protein